MSASPSCPKCGALIFYPSPWNGITPPPAQYSCDCKRDQAVTITSTHTGRVHVIDAAPHCPSCSCRQREKERQARNEPPVTWTSEPGRPLPTVLL